MYKISLKKEIWTLLAEENFRFSTNGMLAAQQTIVELRYDATHLHVRFQCKDNPFTSQNTMVTHNDDLYNQEVFEIFISPSATDSPNYLEVELNPNNALWVGHVFNPTLGEAGGNKLTMVPYNEANITHTVSVAENEWAGEMSLPWKLIGEKSDVYRINFYRIISKVSHENPDWICTADSCDFTCWSPTMSGHEPAFHRPKRFGVLHLE